jgi:hypothetical protein
MRRAQGHPDMGDKINAMLDNYHSRVAAEREQMASGRAVRAKPGITIGLLPVGTGIEVSRYEPQEGNRP